MFSQDMRARTYLGDGLYAAWDNFHVWLMTERDGVVDRVALEAAVMEKFLAYVAFVKRMAHEKETFAEVPEEL